jgi:hypothetical protein
VTTVIVRHVNLPLAGADVDDFSFKGD